MLPTHTPLTANTTSSSQLPAENPSDMACCTAKVLEDCLLSPELQLEPTTPKNPCEIMQAPPCVSDFAECQTVTSGLRVGPERRAGYLPCHIASGLMVSVMWTFIRRQGCNFVARHATTHAFRAQKPFFQTTCLPYTSVRTCSRQGQPSMPTAN
jgi:hypothetical protein